MEDWPEAELEAFIVSKYGTDDAKYVLGYLMIEGSSEIVSKNESKGLNYIKEAAKKDHLLALEYKTYYDIRFDTQPNLEKITANLEKIIAGNKSSRACNTLAELNHASAGVEAKTPEAKKVQGEKMTLAAKYYQMSAEQGDIIGLHWMGVFYHEGFGVAKNLEKAILFLTKASNAGNGQSMFQLYTLFSGKEGQSKKLFNAEIAYGHLLNAILHGVTYFDEAINFFKACFEVLAPVFVKAKGIALEVNEDTKKDITNMHDSYIKELKVNFSAALSKERLYHRPCGFLNDQQIWMVGVNVVYFLDKVLRFNHCDFLKAMKVDVGPILGEFGLWSLKAQQDIAKDKKDKDLKNKLQVAIDLIEKYVESEFEVIGNEKKYYFINKYGPKKCPEAHVKRSDIKTLYSWQHYAPLMWFDHIKKTALAIKSEREGKTELVQKYCSSCQSPEGVTLKHKMCSQCKQRFYCSIECQKQDWKSGHKDKCKSMRK